MRGLRDRPEFAWGEDGENAIARKLQRDGCVVHAVAQYEGHSRAPVLWSLDSESNSVRTVLADLIVWDRGNPPRFVEVKRKRTWVRFSDPRWPNRGLETGFNDSQWDHYVRAQEDTGTSLLVFWIHEGEPPTGVFVSTIAALAPHRRYWDGYTPKGKKVGEPESLFPRSVLKRFCDLADLELKHQPAQREIALPAKRVALSNVQFDGSPRAHGLKPSLAKCTEPLVQPQSQALQTNFFDVVDEPQRRASGERVRR